MIPAVVSGAVPEGLKLNNACLWLLIVSCIEGSHRICKSINKDNIKTNRMNIQSSTAEWNKTELKKR